MKLIINGDDYGLSEGVSKGILKAYKDGILTDTTAMTNMPYFEESVRLAKEAGITKMGIHLTFTCGKPILGKEEVPSICDDNGDFYKRKDIPCNIKLDEVEKELRAQVAKFKESGLELNHIDGHHHFFAYKDELFNIIIKLAEELNVPIRCPINEKRVLVEENNIMCPDYFDNSFYGQNISIEYLIKRLELLKDEYNIVEFMTHPAIDGEELKGISSYNLEREIELKILTSNDIKDYINKNKIELISFSDI